MPNHFWWDQEIKKEGRQQHPCRVDIVPIIGALVILSICAGIFTYYLKERKNQTVNNSDSETGESLSIFSYDGKVKYKEIINATKKFDPRNLIGTGGYGKVYKENLSFGTIVAVKKLNETTKEEIPNPTVKQEFLNEVSALTEIRDKNVTVFLNNPQQLRVQDPLTS